MRDWLKKLLGVDDAKLTLRLNKDELGEPNIVMWATSTERDWFMNRRPRVYLFAAVGGLAILVAAILAQPGSRSKIDIWWASLLAALGAVILIYCTFPYWAARLAFRERSRMMTRYRADVAIHHIGQITHGEQIPLGQLFELNRRQLDVYLESSRRQQRSAFHAAQAANITAFVALVAGVLVSLQQNPATDKYIVAGLSGLGALLSAFLGATFLKMARRADRQLSLYYAEPHMNGRIIVAERLAQALCKSGEQTEGAKMIDALLSWPLPKDDDKKGKTNDSAKSSARSDSGTGSVIDHR